VVDGSTRFAKMIGKEKGKKKSKQRGFAWN